MIVFRKQERVLSRAQCLTALTGLLRQAERQRPLGHEQAVELLIEWGAFESAAVDALCPERDDSTAVTEKLSRAGCHAGHVVHASWEGVPEEAFRQLSLMKSVLGELSEAELPERLCLREPEGYAHYGLYPETYLEAAKKFFAASRPERIVCIGLRSIGTSLAAVVAAALEARGCAVTSFTMRPRGDPFSRSVLLTPEFAQTLRRLSDRYFLVIDEGPGMSGSSICAAAEALAGLGIADSRIVLFPSWETDGSHFISQPARERWAKHPKVTAWFDDILLTSGRLADVFRCDALQDISAGMWRPLFYPSATEAPAVQHQHEKRKFLCRNSHRTLVKFAGLGKYGRAKFARALALADAGFAPPALELSNGFLTLSFVDGRPLSRREFGAEALDAVARYLSHLSRAFPAERDMGFDELIGMVQRNTLLGLGPAWVPPLHRLERFRTLFEETGPTALDGRMLPHEWLRTARGYLKTDGIDHHADQFFPCCQDIAWDLAGSSIECGLGGEAEAYLIGRYQGLSRDRTLTSRLPLYRIAYLAFRLGYVTFALNGAGSPADARKFRAMAGRYRTLLKEGIERLAPA